MAFVQFIKAPTPSDTLKPASVLSMNALPDFEELAKANTWKAQAALDIGDLPTCDSLPGYTGGSSEVDDDDLYSEGGLSSDSGPVFSDSDESTTCTQSEGYSDEQWGVDFPDSFTAMPTPPDAPYSQQPRRSLVLRRAATGAGSAVRPWASEGKMPTRVSALEGDEWAPLLLDALFRPIDGSGSDTEDEWLDKEERQDFLDMSKRVLRSLVPRRRA